MRGAARVRGHSAPSLLPAASAAARESAGERGGRVGRDLLKRSTERPTSWQTYFLCSGSHGLDRMWCSTPCRKRHREAAQRRPPQWPAWGGRGALWVVGGMRLDVLEGERELEVRPFVRRLNLDVLAPLERRDRHARRLGHRSCRVPVGHRVRRRVVRPKHVFHPADGCCLVPVSARTCVSAGGGSAR